MSRNDEFLAMAQKTHLLPGKPAPIVLTRGKGCRVEDVDGRSYLDFSAGIAVLSVGHAHPKLAAAICEQAHRLMHVSNLYYNDQGILLSQEIAKRTGFDRVFFCNSGTEANEALFKLARRYHYEKNQSDKVQIITAFGGFHGRTMGALAMTAQPKYHVGLGPMLEHIDYVPFGNSEALRQKMGPATAAVMLEPIQAEGGIMEASSEYFREVRKLCNEHGALLFFDEVQTGYGRTGRFLAREWFDVRPDACSLAKGIAGGFPLGAIAITEEVSQGFPVGSHGTTYGGNPLAAAAGRAVLQIFDEERLVENSERLGAYLRKGLEALVPSIGPEVASQCRGRGLLQGVVLAENIEAHKVIQALRQAGMLISLAGGHVLRITPPLNVTAPEIDEGLATLGKVLADAKQFQASA